MIAADLGFVSEFFIAFPFLIRNKCSLMIAMAVRPVVVLKYLHKHSLGHQETPFLAQPDKGCLESV